MSGPGNTKITEKRSLSSGVEEKGYRTTAGEKLGQRDAEAAHMGSTSEQGPGAAPRAATMLSFGAE